MPLQVLGVSDGGTTMIDHLGFYLTAAKDEDHELAEAPPTWSGDQIAALQHEEQFWVSHIVQYLALKGGERRSDQPCQDSPCGGASTASERGDDEEVASLHQCHRIRDEDAQVTRATARRLGAAMRRRILRFGGVPFPTLRRLVWGFFTGSLQRTCDVVRSQAHFYERLTTVPIDADVSDVIQRDLGRTFPTHCLFRDDASPGQVSLRRVLHAYSVLDPSVGYCQGMGFVVSMLLLHAPEEEAFWMFVQLMQGRQFSLRRLYLPGFPLLQHFFVILRRVMKSHLPTLHRHFENEGLNVAYFAAQWFMTLFVYQLPMSLATRVWDVFVVRGWTIVFQVALALLQWEMDKLLKMSLEDTLLFLKDVHDGKSEDELLRRALDVPVSDEDLLDALG